jgi:hypothetical protein
MKIQWRSWDPNVFPIPIPWSIIGEVCFDSVWNFGVTPVSNTQRYLNTSATSRYAKNECSFVKLEQLLPVLWKKKSFCKKNVVWTLWFWMDFAPGALKLLCENTMKFDLPIMLLECSTNSVNWRRTEFVHVDMCILLKLIEVYSWKQIRPTTGFGFVFATCHSVLPGTCVEWWPTWSCQHAQDQLFWS